MLRSKTWKESSDLVCEIDQGEKAGTSVLNFSSFPRKIPFIKFFPIITTQYLCLVLNIKDKVGLFYEESAPFWGRSNHFTKPMFSLLISLHGPRPLSKIQRRHKNIAFGTQFQQNSDWNSNFLKHLYLWQKYLSMYPVLETINPYPEDIEMHTCKSGRIVSFICFIQHFCWLNLGTPFIWTVLIFQHFFQHLQERQEARIRWT